MRCRLSDTAGLFTAALVLALVVSGHVLDRFVRWAVGRPPPR